MMKYHYEIKDELITAIDPSHREISINRFTTEDQNAAHRPHRLRHFTYGNVCPWLTGDHRRPQRGKYIYTLFWLDGITGRFFK